MQIKDVLMQYLATNMDPASFATNRKLDGGQRKKLSLSAAVLVEEVSLRTPKEVGAVEISDGQGWMLEDLIVQITIDLADEDNEETWRKMRIEGLERICLMIHGIVTVNILLQN